MVLAAKPVAAWHSVWTEATAADKTLQLYALIDGAASGQRFTGLLQDTQLPVECLFGYALDAPIAAATPKLAAIGNSTESPLVSWLSAQVPTQPVATLLASALDLPSLKAHLRASVEVELKDIDSMFLAVWDPAILGTLLGAANDSTLRVAGPVLKPEQVNGLLASIAHWWYWDRDGHLHDAVPTNFNSTSQPASEPWIVLDQEQVDALVEASVPDHLLQHIHENQPELLERVPETDRYRFVCRQLDKARKHGLTGTGDLVNYTCLAMAYGASFDTVPSMAKLLAGVESGSFTFDAALDQVVEADLELAATPDSGERK